MSDEASESLKLQPPGRDRWAPAGSAAREPDPTAGSIAIGRILRAVRRHVVLMLAVTAFTTTFSMIAFRQPALYRAKAVLRLVGERQAVAAGIDRESPSDDRHVVPVNSLVPRVRSRAVIGAVVDQLGLQLRPVPILSLLRPPVLPSIDVRAVEVAPDAKADTLFLLFSPSSLTVRDGEYSAQHVYGKVIQVGTARFVVPKPPEAAGAILAILPRDLAIDRVLAQLAVVPLTGTDALEVRYIDAGPHLAQAVTNAVVRTFHASTINSSQEQARRRRVFLDEQLQETERQLSEAQAAVAGFRSQRRLANSADKLARQQSELMNLDVRRGELQADRRVFRSLMDRLKTPNDSARTEELYTLAYSPDIATDPIVGKVFQQLLNHRTRLDSLTTGPYKSTAANPDVVQLRQLVRSSQEDLVRAVRARLGSVEERLAALQDLRARNANEIAALPSLEAEEARLGQKVSALADFANQLRLEHQKARMSEALAAADIEIVDLATLPYLPAGVPWWIKVTLALVFGLVAGTVIALLLEAKNRSIRGPEDLEELLHLRGLGVIPPVTEAIAAEESLALGRSTAPAGELVKPAPQGVVTDSSVWPSVGAEAFRLLYSSLTYGWGERQRTILVTSVAPLEGKTLVAANLAVTFAREGARVLLVDCDLRRPRLHKVFQVARSPGLVDLLRTASETRSEEDSADEDRPAAPSYSMLPGIVRPNGAENAEPASSNGTGVSENGHKTPALPRAITRTSASFRNIRQTINQGLWLLPSGAVVTNPAETLRAGTFRNLLQELSTGFDVIIVDTPPALVSADAVILAPVADDVLLVIRAGKTDRDAADRVHQQLTDAGANVVGAVLNDPEGKVTRDRASYYSYGYPVTPD